MRIYLSVSSNTTTVPYDHVPLLVGTLHKWFGPNNEWHGKTALYSFSWLLGGKKGNGGLIFPKGASFFISAYDDSLIKKVVTGAIEQPQLFSGMAVEEIKIQQTPSFEGEEHFSVASPVLIKRREDDRIKHCLFNDSDANDALTNSIQKKMSLVGMDSSGLSVAFDPDHRSAHTKLVDYNGIKNRANVCAVIVKGSSEQIGFVWNVGVGNSTGIGFGALN